MWGLVVIVALMGLVLGVFLACGFLLFIEFYMRYIRIDFVLHDDVDKSKSKL